MDTYNNHLQTTPLSRDAIITTERLIRPHIRRTPIIEVDPADFGIDCGGLVFKLESLQHAGSFKARGALTNLLTRDIPSAGVVAASLRTYPNASATVNRTISDDELRS